MNKEIEFKVDLNTSFEIPIDEIICNVDDYDEWNYAVCLVPHTTIFVIVFARFTF